MIKQSLKLEAAVWAFYLGSARADKKSCLFPVQEHMFRPAATSSVLAAILRIDHVHVKHVVDYFCANESPKPTCAPPCIISLQPLRSAWCSSSLSSLTALLSPWRVATNILTATMDPVLTRRRNCFMSTSCYPKSHGHWPGHIFSLLYMCKMRRWVEFHPSAWRWVFSFLVRTISLRATIDLKSKNNWVLWLEQLSSMARIFWEELRSRL